MKTKYKVFIPEFYFHSNEEEWREVNKDKSNWLNDTWKNKVYSIYQMLPDLIVVIWEEYDEGGNNIITLYQEILE